MLRKFAVPALHACPPHNRAVRFVSTAPDILSDCWPALLDTHLISRLMRESVRRANTSQIEAARPIIERAREATWAAASQLKNIIPLLLSSFG